MRFTKTNAVILFAGTLLLVILGAWLQFKINQARYPDAPAWSNFFR